MHLILSISPSCVIQRANISDKGPNFHHISIAAFFEKIKRYQTRKEKKETHTLTDYYMSS